MKLIIIIVLLSQIGCRQENKKQPVNNDKQEVTVNKDGKISEDLRNYINESLPDYSILTSADYFAEVKTFLNNDKLPFICESDFNGDDRVDYAILLKKGNYELCLMIISLIEKSYKHQKLDCFDFKNVVDIILSVEEKGKWESIDEIIDVPNDGILVEFAMESLSQAYYWDGKKFVKFLFD